MQIASRITDATVSGGTGPLTLLGTPLQGTKSVVATYAPGTAELPLMIVDSVTGAWEHSYCTIGSNGVITRDVQIETSAGTIAPINFAAGTAKNVYLDTPITLFERSIPYSANIPLDGRYDMGVKAVTAATAFAPIAINQRRGSYCKLTLVMDGSSAISFPGFTAIGTTTLLTAAASVNDLEFRFNGVRSTVSISRAASAGVAPGAVTGVTIGSPGVTSLLVSWANPTAGDAPITNTVSYRATSVGGSYTQFASGVMGTSATITGLTANTQYDVLVTPANGVGPGTAGTASGSTIAAPVTGTLQLSAPSFSTSEGGASVAISVTRVGGSTGTASVSYATSNGTAQAGSDYTATNGSLTWADGDATPKSFNVTIIDDGLVEGSETFNVTLSGATGAMLGAPAIGVVTIIDNDVAVPYAIVGTLSPGSVGTAYSSSLAAVGGTAPYTFAVQTGTLPAGLNLSSAGVLSGTPTAVASSTVTVSATDSAGTPATVTSSQMVPITAALAAFTFETETNAIISAMTTAGATPSAARQYFINRTVKRLKTAGVWALATAAPTRSRLFVFATEAAGGAALIDWFNPSNVATVAGSPSFTIQRGYSSTTTGAAVRTGVMLQSLSQNDVHLGLFCGTGTTTASASDIGALDSAGNGLTVCAYNSSNSAATVRCNGANIVLGNGPWFSGGNGQTFVNRNSSTGFDSGRYGSIVNAATASTSAAAVTNPEITVVAINNNGTIGNGSGRVIGGVLLAPSLTDAQRKEAHAAIRTYLDGVRFGEPTITEAGVGPSVVTTDALFLGATSASVVAANTAKRRAGMTAIIVGGERDRSVNSLGGMAANGLGYTDVYDFTSVGGIPRSIYSWINSLRGTADSNTQAGFSANGQLFNYAMRRMLDSSRTATLPIGQTVPVYWANRVQSVTQDGAGVYTVVTGDGRQYKTKTFVDNTDSQESFNAFGTPSISGKEATGTGSEAVNGYRGSEMFYLPRNINNTTYYRIDPYVTPGNPGSGLIAGVTLPPTTTIGAPDPTTQAYGFRLSLTTDLSSAVAWPTTPPAGYAESNYEYIARMLAAEPGLGLGDIFNVRQIDTAGVQFDFNCSERLLITSDIAGSGTAWVAAQSGTFSDRETVYKNVENRNRGLIYWILNTTDSRLPAAVRTSMQNYFLFGTQNLDFHPNDSAYFANMMYVRECRRLNGPFKITANDIAAADGTTPRSIKTVAVGSYASDDHMHGMVAYDDGFGMAVYNQGGYYDESTVQGNKRGPVPMEVMLTDPSFGLGSGYIVTVGLSATQPAYSVLRMETTRMELGQAAGEMAVLRKENGTDVRLMDYPTLRARILGGPETVPAVLPQVN